MAIDEKKLITTIDALLDGAREAMRGGPDAGAAAMVAACCDGAAKLHALLPKAPQPRPEPTRIPNAGVPR